LVARRLLHVPRHARLGLLQRRRLLLHAALLALYDLALVLVQPRELVRVQLVVLRVVLVVLVVVVVVAVGVPSAVRSLVLVVVVAIRRGLALGLALSPRYLTVKTPFN
jgi:hypothetical protein